MGWVDNVIESYPRYKADKRKPVKKTVKRSKKMPCYDPPPTREELDRWEKERVAKELEKFSHNSPVAEMLCAVMGVIENTGNKPLLYGALESKQQKAVEEWWEDHKERDRVKAREEKRKHDREVERERALLKLTPAEKKLLGVK